MTKHPLLPDTYLDTAIHSAILFALSPYKLPDRLDISNPRLKWDLDQAWQDAQSLLVRDPWKRLGTEEYELAADADVETEWLNTMLAGIVARQILSPDLGIFVRRVDYRKGGEVAMIISAVTLEALKLLLAPSENEKVAPEGKKRWWNFWKRNK